MTNSETKSKLREFWIVPDPANTWRNKPQYEVEGLFHVREVSPGLEVAIQKMIEALEFYSTGWVQRPDSVDKKGLIYSVYQNKIIKEDHGIKANDALETWKEANK